MLRSPEFHFDTIVVATDLSEASSSALRYAQAVAQVHGARIMITHVIDPVGYAFAGGVPIALGEDKAAMEEIHRMEEETRRKGIPVHSRVETGVICDRILQSVIDARADLVILGTRASTGAGRAALGTVARQILARTPCPVLTVPRGAERHIPRGGRWQRVVIATDFSVASLEALAYAHRCAFNQLAVVHAEPCRDHKEHEACLERLRFLAPFNEQHTVPVEHIVDSGEAADLIIRESERMDADLVVLGAPIEELREKDFASSTVLKVISDVRCPVMCVPSTLEMPIRIEERRMSVGC
ncbi:MAG: universal stress protein [Acidobacteriaceae bacterium]